MKMVESGVLVGSDVCFYIGNLGACHFFYGLICVGHPGEEQSLDSFLILYVRYGSGDAFIDGVLQKLEKDQIVDALHVYEINKGRGYSCLP